MTQRVLIVGAAVLLLGVAFWFLKGGGLPGASVPAGLTEVSQTLRHPIAVHHKVTGMVHTYSGTVELQGVCTALGGGLVVRQEDAPYLSLELMTYRVAGCPQTGSTSRMFRAPFSFTYEAQSGQKPPVFEGMLFGGKSVDWDLVEEK